MLSFPKVKSIGKPSRAEAGPKDCYGLPSIPNLLGCDLFLFCFPVFISICRPRLFLGIGRHRHRG